jgi:BirA family transcriptional regulator, biotin operon repressor / biotin---[acetyl-CoA-carboxylase] ligase
MFDIHRLADAKLVAQLEHHDSLCSTSDRALELAAGGDVLFPLLVLADRQTAGRGRGTNRWFSNTGALTFSLALAAPPNQLPPDRWPQVALATGVAVCEALTELAPTADLRLKWPNDVYCAGRKIGGILSESVPGCKDRLVIGIGLNINNSIQNRDLAQIAISLIEHDGITRDLTATLVTILDHFDRLWTALQSEDFASLAESYRRRCLLTGKTVTIQQMTGAALIGLCRGIDDRGRLLIQTADQKVPVISGTISHWE